MNVVQASGGANPQVISESSSRSDEFGVHVETFTAFSVAITAPSRLDAVRCPELRQLTAEQVKPGLAELVIDLRACDFIDSVGLAALVKAMRDTEAVGAEFSLVRPSNADAMRIFRLSKFDEVFVMRDAP